MVDLTKKKIVSSSAKYKKMAAVLVPSFSFTLKQISIYYGIPIFTMGVIGAFLNIIVFLSLRIFRENSRAFYLMITSTSDLGRFFTVTLTTIIKLWIWNRFESIIIIHL
jgi:hypothetical protein